ncbi:MAG: lysophospholipid acyltransferase family protein [Hyphomicrobiales bacterium]|nr:lysophospholipid acyltransferase family protein [Hyphomicrobiales bacterium]
MSPLLDLRYRLEYAVLRLIIGIVRLFPLDTAAELLARTLRKLGPGGRRHRRALANLEIAFPEKTAEERERIACEMWDNIGRVMAEMMQIDRLLDEPERMQTEEDYFVKRYRGKVGPVVAASMHSGNWELASWPMALCEANAAAVYRLVKNPYVDRYLRSMREKLYPGGLFAKGRGPGGRAGHHAARQLGSYLRQGGRSETCALAFLADLYDGKGVPVPFFGQDAKSTAFPAMLARRTGARFWVGRVLRQGRQSRFRISVKEIKVPRTEDPDADIRWITAAVQAQFEQWIREAPEQYMWTNRRFA